MQSGNISYKINKIIYKNVDYYKYFILYGYAYDLNGNEVSYSAKINGKDGFIDLVPVKRNDLKKSKNKMVGFRMRIDCLDDCVESFQLFANKECLLNLDSSKISEYENNHYIDYAIDSLKVDDNHLAITAGWVSSIDLSEVKVEILDLDNRVIESSCRTESRPDLIQLHIIQEKQLFSGFRVSFEGNKNQRYKIRFSTDKEVYTTDLVASKRSKLALMRAYITHFNGENFKKATSYIKRNGVHGFLHRLKYGVNTNNIIYQDWFFRQRVNADKLRLQRECVFSYNPKISILVPTFNTKEEYLKEMVDTVVEQSYPNWELCIADGSTTDFVETYVQKNYAQYGDKIKFTRLDQNYGIAGNTNKALELATGDYIGLYDHDDMLELDCLYEVVSSLQEFQYDIVYTDEDKFDDAKKEYTDPNFKPDFSVDLFRSHNYITHFFCVNKKIVDIVGGELSEYDGAQDYDFMFRCIEKANGIYHIHRILYHWRMHPLSTAQDPESKMYCYEAGKKAIEDHYKRIGVEATVEMMPKPLYGLYHTKYSTKNNPLVSILIPNMNHKSVLKTCIDSLYNVNSYQNFEIVIVENNSTEQEIFDYYEQLKQEHSNVKVVTWSGEFNYSAINNYGAKYCNGDYILLLNNDTEMIKPDALEEMLGCCMRDEVGAVGAKLLYADDTVQHAGVVVGFAGYAGHINHGINKDDYGYMMRAVINCNYSACTAACLMVKKSVFNQVGGFDEQFKVACNDVDLCLKIRKENYLIVYDAFALWHHYESKSRGYDDNNKDKLWRFNSEVDKFQAKWKDILENGDPYYNKNWNISVGPFKLQ